MKGNKILKRIMNITAAFLLIFASFGKDAFADTIKTSGGETLEITTDGAFIYMDYEGPWSYYLGTQISVGVNGAPVSGSMSGIVLNTENSNAGGNFQVYNAWGQPIEGAKGQVQNIDQGSGNGYETMKWSVVIPVSVYGGAGLSDMSFEWKGGRTEISVKQENASDPGTEQAKEEKEETEEEAGPLEGVPGIAKGEEAESGSGENEGVRMPVITSGLAVDGYYTDWSGYPETKITYLGNNTKAVHIGQMAVEGDRLYAHFSMNDLYTSQMKIQIWNLQINGNTYPLQILPVTGNGDIDWSNSQTKWGAGTHNNFDVFVGYYPSCAGDVAFTVYDDAYTMESKGDEIEFSISLDRLAEITGVPVDRMSTIRLSNPNIGAEGVEISGTPTGPWLGALAALLIATVYLAKRRKEENGLS